MARITKAELEQQVADMAAQIERLSAALVQARAQLDAQGIENEVLRAEQHASRTPSRRIVAAGYVAPAWQAERAAAMAAARAAAMRLGVTTKVAAC